LTQFAAAHRAVIHRLRGATAIRTRARHVIDAIRRTITKRTIDDLLIEFNTLCMTR
jgi:hypothetical protein